MDKPRILVINNYLPDKQKSMLMFSRLLISIYAPLANVDCVSPPALLTRLPYISSTLSKYLAYIDKLLIFPIWLLSNSRRYKIIHIADHGNAFYSFFCPKQRTVVTCHDLLAVRGAMGDHSVVCTSSPFGPILQRLIMFGLRHTSRVAFVSKATYRDYLAISPSPRRQRLQVIPNALNAPFMPDISSYTFSPNELSLTSCSPYLLMVGSSLPRKNRSLALQVLKALADRSPYFLIFAGAALTEDEAHFKNSSSCGDRLISIVNPSHEILNLLYCRAHALLFPSFSEGFGWPLIEAQASGCPIIASNTTCIPEVAGSGALYSHPTDVSQFITHILLLENSEVRSDLRNLGFLNLKRFNYDNIATAYHSFACL